jgi:hypothetical protein
MRSLSAKKKENSTVLREMLGSFSRRGAYTPSSRQLYERRANWKTL